MKNGIKKLEKAIKKEQIPISSIWDFSKGGKLLGSVIEKPSWEK